MSKGLGPLPEARKPDRNGAGWFTAGQMHAYAAEQVAAERERLRSLIADDASAITYQSMGQYRTALLRFLRG
jgi:hypothetical protein